MNSKESGVNDLQEQKDKAYQELKDAEETIESLRTDLSSKESELNISKDEKEKLSQELKEKAKEIESLNTQLSSKESGVNNLQEQKNGLSQELKEAKEIIESLNNQLSLKESRLNNLQEQKDGLSQDLEKSQEIIESLRTDLSSKQVELDNLEDEKAESEKKLSNAISKISTLENMIKEKEKEIESLENKSKKDKESTLSEREEIESRLQDFIEKIENPYKDLLKAISENSKSKEIEDYLKFKNDRGLSKSMIIFSLINEDALARKIASFYAERKEVMIEEDFEIIKEVNKIYENDKPWGILYAEPEGKYLSSLVRDKKSSDIYKTFVAMYSPAYRKDEDGNSPLKGIVDGKK